MVLHLLDLASRWQELVEMATPTCGIFTLPVTPHGRPIENGFDAPSQPARRLRLRVPDWSQGFHHEPDID
jgi:hypothetical protein